MWLWTETTVEPTMFDLLIANGVLVATSNLPTVLLFKDYHVLLLLFQLILYNLVRKACSSIDACSFFIEII